MLERRPIVGLPTCRQVFGLAFRESDMFEHDLRARALLDEFESGKRIGTPIPAAHAPCLHDPLARHEYQLAANNIAAKKRKRATLVRIDLGLGDFRAFLRGAPNQQSCGGRWLGNDRYRLRPAARFLQKTHAFVLDVSRWRSFFGAARDGSI